MNESKPSVPGQPDLLEHEIRRKARFGDDECHVSAAVRVLHYGGGALPGLPKGRPNHEPEIRFSIDWSGDFGDDSGINMASARLLKVHFANAIAWAELTSQGMKDKAEHDGREG